MTIQMHMDSRSGMTLIEVSIAVALGAILSGVVLSIGVETLKFASYADEDFIAQVDANRGFDRVSEVLRKTGWNTQGVDTYPRVIEDGAAIEFRLLVDLDGNGFSFDGETGDLEWSNAVFTIRRQADGTLGIFDQGGNCIWLCTRSIASVTFTTSIEDPSLHYQEIRITIVGSRVTTDGSTLEYTADGSIYMRN